MKGKIIKGIAGFYYVYGEDQNIYECKAKGAFRNKSIKPLVGDDADIDIIDDKNKKGNITQIFQRTNRLIRPAVANVDQAMIVFALNRPTPNLNLLDRFLVMMSFQNISTIICFNKTDIADRKFMSRLENIYHKAGYTVIFSSTQEKEGIDEVKKLLKNKTTVLAGPSGVGKSSMLNVLTNQYTMKTGEISEKIGRGRHTTRHSEIFFIDKDTYLLDTPGFSSLDVPGMTKEKLGLCFPEFLPYIEKCRFAGCSHISEPDCGVKQALEEHNIAADRYENYTLMYNELKEKNYD